jgi:hypothetical protein
MMQPSKEEIIQKLNGIVDDNISREQVSNWAMDYINNDEIHVADTKAWDLLMKVGSVELMNNPKEYLYSVDDIKKWIRD